MIRIIFFRHGRKVGEKSQEKSAVGTVKDFIADTPGVESRETGVRSFDSQMSSLSLIRNSILPTKFTYFSFILTGSQ